MTKIGAWSLSNTRYKHTRGKKKKKKKDGFSITLLSTIFNISVFNKILRVNNMLSASTTFLTRQLCNYHPFRSLEGKWEYSRECPSPSTHHKTIPISNIYETYNYPSVSHLSLVMVWLWRVGVEFIEIGLMSWVHYTNLNAQSTSFFFFSDIMLVCG